MNRPHPLLTLVILFALAPASGARSDALAQAPAAAEAWSLFGSTEIRSTSLKAFSKWTGMLARHRREAEAVEAARSGDCRPNPRFPCPRAAWQAFMRQVRDLPPSERLAAANRYLNRAPYIIDPVNWGVADYWATADEFLHRDGDCEDYAIVKYLTLKALGFAPETMRIVVLHDENLNTTHAVLALSFEGDVLILDNQIRQVVDDDRIRHYRPIYSINETAWWYHSGWQDRSGHRASGAPPANEFN